MPLVTPQNNQLKLRPNYSKPRGKEIKITMILSTQCEAQPWKKTAETLGGRSIFQATVVALGNRLKIVGRGGAQSRVACLQWSARIAGRGCLSVIHYYSLSVQLFRASLRSAKLHAGFLNWYRCGFLRNSPTPIDSSSAFSQRALEWRRGRDSNSRSTSGRRFSRPVVSTAHPPLR